MEVGFPVTSGQEEPGVIELSISPALAQPFCEVAQEYFSGFGDEKNSPRRRADNLGSFIERLCLDYDDIHACNKTNFGIRMRALTAMTLMGLPDMMPSELWQTNEHGQATPAPSLIRAALVVPWPVIIASDSMEEAARHAWAVLVDRCIAAAISPLGAGTLTNQGSRLLH